MALVHRCRFSGWDWMALMEGTAGVSWKPHQTKGRLLNWTEFVSVSMSTGFLSSIGETQYLSGPPCIDSIYTMASSDELLFSVSFPSMTLLYSVDFTSLSEIISWLVVSLFQVFFNLSTCNWHLCSNTLLQNALACRIDSICAVLPFLQWRPCALVHLYWTDEPLWQLIPWIHWFQ